MKSSDPIPIGQFHHTVSGHEAMDLAKRLNEELAAQQENAAGGSLGSNRAKSPETEPRSRSFEQKEHKSKGKKRLLVFMEFYSVLSSFKLKRDFIIFSNSLII